VCPARPARLSFTHQAGIAIGGQEPSILHPTSILHQNGIRPDRISYFPCRSTNPAGEDKASLSRLAGLTFTTHAFLAERQAGGPVHLDILGNADPAPDWSDLYKIHELLLDNVPGFYQRGWVTKDQIQ
jgi:hypothetical protein